MSIRDKIYDLGGQNEKSSCNDKSLDSRVLFDFEKKFNLVLPQSYKEFLIEFGAISFAKSVGVLSMAEVPRFGEKLIEVPRFLNANEFSSCFIGKIIRDYSDQFPHQFIPVAEAGLASGDFFGFNLEHNDEAIYFWWHEGFENGEQLYRVASSFSDFIDRLENIDDSSGEKPIVISAKTSTRLDELAMKFKKDRGMSD